MKNITKILSLVLLASIFCSCDTQEKVDKKIGLQLWSVKDDMKEDAKGTIEKVGAMGYTYVEAAEYRDRKFYGMEPEEFKAVLEENGLSLISSHTGQHLPDSAGMKDAMKWWDDCIEDHKKAGAKFIVKPSMSKAGFDSIAGLQNVCDYYNAIGEKCKANGIKFGFHNHAGEFGEVDGQTIYDYMLENTDPDKVFYQLDLYWIHKGGKNAVDYFNKYPGRFLLFHVKDYKEVGESGKIDFQPIYEAADKAGMLHSIVEVEDYNFTPLESVQKSLEYLQDAEYVTR